MSPSTSPAASPAGSPTPGASVASFFDLKAEAKKGVFDFEQLRGKATLIVNTASKCGFTPQYTGLEKLHQQYKDQGLVVLGFPCDQFGGQEPGTDDEIESFCQVNHGVTFPLMKKSEVNGEGTSPVYQFLKSHKSGLLGLTRIKWNFEKFLIDQNGHVLQRYSSLTSPDAIAKDVEKLLHGAKSQPPTPQL